MTARARRATPAPSDVDGDRPDRHVDYVPLDNITPALRNPKRHDLDRICASIRRFGFVTPGVRDERTGRIVAGHGRQEALTRLRAEGDPPPAGIRVDGDRWLVPVIAGWSSADDAEAEAYLVIDNSHPALGGWDDDELAELLGQLQHTDADLFALTGFTDDDLAAMLAGGDGGSGGDGGGGSGVNPSLAERFLVPPFDVLDARQGWWRERKRTWLAVGIRSELGRTRDGDGDGGHALTFQGWARRDPQYYDKKRAAEQALGRALSVAEFEASHYEPPENALAGGTSVFDPVLCELAVRWFSPPAGVVLDPFAGGSVRGIVAAILGREYHGNDLSERQVESNREQAAAILAPREADEPVMVKVSAAQARQLFHGCTPDYIRDVCHGACCRSKSQPGGILVVVHPSEAAAVAAAGANIDDGRIVPEGGRCPYQQRDTELCGVHGTDAKPFGCIASPFTVNDAGTLIVRNRYRLLKCFKDDRDGPPPPAYVAFRGSLDRIFGDDVAAELCAHLDAGGGDITLPVSRATWQMLRDNDAAKHGTPPAGGAGTARWDVGDSAEWVETLEPESADLIFTCPPYYDLEEYSADPADLSTMSYADFDRAYARIIAGAAAALRPDRFAVFVTGDARDKRGILHDLRGSTIAAAEAAGLRYCSGAVILTPIGSVPVVAARTFAGTRTLSRVHQDVLVFCKGDRSAAAKACGTVEVHLPDELAETDDDDEA